MHTVSNSLAASLELELFGAVFKRSINLTVFTTAPARWKAARSYGITDQSETRCYLFDFGHILAVGGTKCWPFY